MRRLAAAACLVLLAACSANSSPQAALQARMNAITEAANAKDAAALRSAVNDFLQEVRSQSANADITLRKAQDLQTVAMRLLQNASLLEASPQSASPEPVPSEVPSPSPSPSPSPEPSPSSEPSATEAPPSPEPSPILEISASPAGGFASPAASAAP